MEVAIVKYNAGNVQSVIFCLQRLGLEPLFTDDPEQLAKADKVIFPGQGEASSAMRYLKEKNLHQVLANLKQPFLGICIGMQLLCTHSEEGDTPCLGVFDLAVKRFTRSPKVPHMGWNTYTPTAQDSIFAGVQPEDHLYFVHSYFVETGPDTIATASYGQDFSALIRKDNYVAAQPHLEKSAAAGELLIKNFLEI